MNPLSVKLNNKNRRGKLMRVGELSFDVTPLFPLKISDEAFFKFCRDNHDLRIEMTKEGDVLIMPPTGSETGRKNFKLNTKLGIWIEKTQTGEGFDSSTGFLLPNGAKRSPDSAWIKLERWNALTKEQKKKFAPICPDFVVEIRSETDSLAMLQAKMEEYVENGAELGWLLDASDKKVYIYRQNQEVEILENPEKISGESVLPGFELKLEDYLVVMANEAWLNGKLAGFAPLMMPAAHALTEAIKDLEKYVPALSEEELLKSPNGASSIAFHLRHIAGSIDRLLSYARNEELNEAQFAWLINENAEYSEMNAAELTQKAVDEIKNALETLKNTPSESLFEEKFVGRKKLPTNVFGLLFHIAEHTARHVGQIITTAKIVRSRLKTQDFTDETHEIY